MANKKQLAIIRSQMATRKELLKKEQRLYVSLISMSLQIIMIRALYQPLNDAANVAHFNAYYDHIRKTVAAQFAPFPGASFEDLLKNIESNIIKSPVQFETFHNFRRLLTRALYSFHFCDGTFGEPNDMLQHSLTELNQEIETNREACLTKLGFLVEMMKPIEKSLPIEQFRPILNYITFSIGPTLHYFLQPILTECYFQLKNRDQLLINYDENVINKHAPNVLIKKLDILNKQTEASINKQMWFVRRVAGFLFLSFALGYMLGANVFSSEMIMIVMGMLTTACINIIDDGKQAYASFRLPSELDKRSDFLRDALGKNLKSIKTHKQDFLHSSYLALTITNSTIPNYKACKIVKNCLQKHGIKVLGFGKDYIMVAGDTNFDRKKIEIIKSQIANAIRIDYKSHLLGKEFDQIAEVLNIVCPSEFLKRDNNLVSLKFSLTVPEAYQNFVNVETLKNIFPKNEIKISNGVITITGIEPCSDKNKLAQLIADIKSHRISIRQDQANDGQFSTSTQINPENHKKKVTTPRNTLQSESATEPTPTEPKPMELAPMEPAPNNAVASATQPSSSKIRYLHIPALNNPGETTETIELEDGVFGCLGFDLDYAKRKSSKVVFSQSKDILFGLKYAATRFGDSGLITPRTHTVNTFTIKIKGTTGMFRVKSEEAQSLTGERAVIFNRIKNDK